MNGCPSGESSLPGQIKPKKQGHLTGYMFLAARKPLLRSWRERRRTKSWWFGIWIQLRIALYSRDLLVYIWSRGSYLCNFDLFANCRSGYTQATRIPKFTGTSTVVYMYLYAPHAFQIPISNSWSWQVHSSVRKYLSQAVTGDSHIRKTPTV